MKRILLLLSLSLLMALPMKGQSFFGAQSLTPVAVDKLSDEEILLFKRNFQTKNLTEPEALKDLKERGMSEAELRKLKLRLTRLDELDDQEQLQMLTMQMMQWQDSVKQASRSQLELSALERLYALDSNVFGAELFRNEKMDFAPNLRIATPPTYRLGPDDVLEITVYGFQEFNRSFRIMPDGVINVPYAGVVSVIGLTVKEAKARIYQLLSANGYNTLKTGKSELTLSLKEVRSVDVTVVGGKVPGRYTIPAIASPYHVLHLAGGPASKGSYRDIQLVRNGEVVATIDLYELLVDGTKHDDIRLEDADVIFIPTYTSRVTLAGEFKRPRTFELKGEERMEDLLTYAGGFTEQAYKGKVYVERIGRVGFVAQVVNSQNFGAFIPQNGDFILADTLNDRFRDRISVSGAVQMPGYYASGNDLQVHDLLEQAGGLREDAIPSSLVLVRKDSLGTYRYTWPRMSDVLLEGDSLLVGMAMAFDAPQKVSVRGSIGQSTDLPYGEGLTLAQALILAGGMNDLADRKNIEIARKSFGTFTLITVNAEGPDFGDARTFLLQPLDAVTVRKKADYKAAPVVTLQGEVRQEGAYGLKDRFESLHSLINRAGGLTRYADEHGVFVVRQRKVVLPSNEDLELDEQTRGEVEKVMADTIAISARLLKSARPTFYLQDGDVVQIGEKALTVQVLGAVYNPGTVSFESGKSFGHYLSAGGGVSDEGMGHRAYVLYPNGKAYRTKRFGFIVWSRPAVVPGSTVVVPEKQSSRGTLLEPQDAAVYTGVLSALATTTIGIISLLRP